MKMKSNTTTKFVSEKVRKERKERKKAKNKETRGGLSFLCPVRSCPSDPLVCPHVGSWGREGRKLGAEARAPRIRRDFGFGGLAGTQSGRMGWGVDFRGSQPEGAGTASVPFPGVPF